MLSRHAICRYKSEIRKDDKEALRALVKEQYHYQVTPEIHRELEASRSGILPLTCHCCSF